jgi:hypothetical protein
MADTADTEGPSSASADGCYWMMQRLRGMGADPRGRKRLHVLRVFAALVVAETDLTFLTRFLEPLVEVAMRARMFKGTAEGLGSSEEAPVTAADDATLRDGKQAAGDLLEALEKKLGASAVIGVYAEVQRRLQATRAEKKRILASEAVSNPRAHAQRKAEKAIQKKESRKRKNLRHAAGKGLKKRRGVGACAILTEES